MLEPIIVPKDRIGCLSSAEAIPTTISGTEVPIAIKKKLIVYSGKCRCLATLDEDLMKNSVDFISSRELIKIRNTFSRAVMKNV